jgi:hypothetical protein
MKRNTKRRPPMSKTFDKTQTYWNHKGKHQEVYDRLFPKLVPASGETATTAGEWLRCISKLYYDYYNNGGGNIADGALRYHMEYIETRISQLSAAGARRFRLFEQAMAFLREAEDDDRDGSTSVEPALGQLADEAVLMVEKALELLTDEIILMVEKMDHKTPATPE